MNHVLYEDLDGIVLLGFSYGGMVVTGALDALAGRVRHLVYLDAFVPADGDSLFGLLGLDDRPAPAVGTDWQVVAAPRVFDDPAEADFMTPRRNATARAVLHRAGQPVEAVGGVRVRAHLHPGDRRCPGRSRDRRVRRGRRARPHVAVLDHHEIDTNHMVPSNRPAELAAILDDLA